jgi:hypothetical protein
MSARSTKKAGLLSRVWSSLSRTWVVRVPDEVSCCEFECRRSECAQGDWECCDLRREYAERLRSRRGGQQGTR